MKNRFVVKSLHSIAKDEKLSNQAVDHIIGIMNTEQMYEEKPDPKTKVMGLIPNPQVMSVRKKIFFLNFLNFFFFFFRPPVL
jgi:hypothetical protein